MDTATYMTLDDLQAHQSQPLKGEALRVAIDQNITNWAQWLLDEGFEGGYFMAHVQGATLQITDMNGHPVAKLETNAASYAQAFQDDARLTMLTIQSQLRRLIDQHILK